MRGQVWVETVIYTLIGLSLIGLVLSLVTPRINEYRDRATIEQTIESMSVIDGKINEVLQAPGNVRVVDFRMKQGALYFDAMNDTIFYVLDGTSAVYSEVGQEASIGRVSVLTERKGSDYTVTLTLPYSVNIDYSINQTVRKYTAASLPYRFSFTHEGFTLGETSRATVFVEEISGS